MMHESQAVSSPRRPSLWSRLLVGDARTARLHGALAELSEIVTLRINRAPQDKRIFLEEARYLLERAGEALDARDLNMGWGLLLEAERWSVQASSDADLEKQAERLREEVREKLSGWRQLAALRVLGDQGTPATMEAVREALRIRNEHSNNEYHKFDLLAGQLFLVGILLLAGVIAILVVSWAGVSPLDGHTNRLAWGGLLGGVGGLLSSARGLTLGAQRKIPAQVADWPVTLIRPVLGAAAGIGAWLVATAGFVTIGASDQQLAPLVTSFVAGFSERYFLSLLPSGDK